MPVRPANDGQPWTRDQLILALELYCRIPWGRISWRNALVRDLAAAIGRTPSSVARKLGNFGAFDPVLAARDVSGLTHASKQDRVIWDEFRANWDGLAEHAQQLRTELAPGEPLRPTFAPPPGPSERVVTAKQRLHQSFFRDAVLSSYNARCCITGLPLTECLVASHIIPWSVDEKRRADPTNGLCLSATFDRLFDCGLITITDDLTLRLSRGLRTAENPATISLLANREGQPILPPARFLPDSGCLRWHRDNRFQAA